MAPTKTKGLLERIRDKETVIGAEGYVFEAERRGYLQAGPFVPEFIVEKPQVLQNLYEEFVECGSDVVLAFTYYGHRAKLRVVGKEEILEDLNRCALKIARQVADDYGVLMAGNICNSTIYRATPESEKECMELFKEQIQWAVEEKADFILGETFTAYGEASLALKAIKQYGNGLPSVINLSPGYNGYTSDDIEVCDALTRLEREGADVVGLNCGLGLNTILPLMKKAKEVCKGPLACLPVPYRTTDKEPTMFSLTDPETGKRCFPDQLEMHLSCRNHVTTFTEEMKKLGIEYIGLCCGARPMFIRQMAETLGRKPKASRYTMDMSKHMSIIRNEHQQKMAKLLGMTD